MRPIRLFALVVIMLLFFTVALRTPAWSDDKDKSKITGLIISLDAAGGFRSGSFQIREFRTDRRWVILLHRDVDLDDDDDRKGRHLSVGDVVEIKGQFLDGQTFLAKKIKILAHSGAPAPVAGQPPAPSNPPNNALVAVIKTIGIGAAVKAFAPTINSFINGLLQNKGAAVQAQTKVVPILSIAIGISSPGSAYVGAAQVSGPASALARVEAVAVIEADYQTAFRVKALIPVDNLKPWEAFRRVPGVGVSAIIDFRI